MRFAVVAGALVLGAAVTDARSIAPSPSKRTAERMDCGTPTRMARKARHEERDWDATAKTNGVPQIHESLDLLAYRADMEREERMKANKTRKASKHRHHSARSAAVYRTTLPDQPLASSADPVAGTLAEELPQDIEYQIIPVSSGSSSITPHSPVAESRAYLIKPVSPVEMIAPTAVNQTLGEGNLSSGLMGVQDHLETQETSEPAKALLRAIENYRQAVSAESQLE